MAGSFLRIFWNFWSSSTIKHLRMPFSEKSRIQVKIAYDFNSFVLIHSIPEAYWKPSQTSKMELSSKIVNGLPLNTITAYISRALEEKDQNFNGRKNNVFPIFNHHDRSHYVKRKLVKCNKARLTRYIFLSWLANQFHSKVTCEKIAW